MVRYLWLLMMLIWLAGLGLGVWWVWPHLERMALTRDFALAVLWLVIGAAAWIAALNMGLQRYWRRRLRKLEPPVRADLTDDVE